MNHEANERATAIPSQPTEKLIATGSTGPAFRKAMLVERDGLKVVRLTLPPDVEIPEHHANVDVIVTVVRGTGTFTVAGVPRQITAGDIVEMLPRVRHSLRAGEDELELVVVHARIGAGTDAASCGAPDTQAAR